MWDEIPPRHSYSAVVWPLLWEGRTHLSHVSLRKLFMLQKLLSLLLRVGSPVIPKFVSCFYKFCRSGSNLVIDCLSSAVRNMMNLKYILQHLLFHVLVKNRWPVFTFLPFWLSMLWQTFCLPLGHLCRSVTKMLAGYSSSFSALEFDFMLMYTTWTRYCCFF